jgi:hypothetical protein
MNHINLKPGPVAVASGRTVINAQVEIWGRFGPSTVGKICT